MRRSRRLTALALLGVALLAGCVVEESAPAWAPPAGVRVSLVLEPPVVAVGQVADLVLAVVTPPGRSVRPFEPPSEIPGFQLVERETQVAREPSRWVHRIRLRLRAVGVGRFAFPAGEVDVEAAEGAVETVAFDALPLEVVSVLGEHPSRHAPYGVRRLPLSRVSRGALVGAFGAGAVFTLGTLGLAALARRRAAARAEAAEPAVPAAASATTVWEAARADLAAARGRLGADPTAALDAAALALRRYAVRRFGGDAHVRTTPELQAATPPFTMTTRWSRFVALLEDLDAARFPRPSAATSDAARALLDRADVFLEDTVPVDARR